MVLKSFAKLNLSLSVIKKLKNGFHDIQSIFCQINIFDKIIIKKNYNKKNDQIFIKGPFSKHVNKFDNSAHKTLSAMRKYNLISDHYSVTIFKNIPVFAGLGGGSSNAATILRNVSKKKISKNLYNKIIKEISSDVKIFFEKQGYLNSLQTIIKFKNSFKLYFLVIYPNLKCSTKEIYSKVRKFSSKEKYLVQDFRPKKQFIKRTLLKKNDLQSIVEKKYPLIRKILKDIKSQRGCYFSRMTGSGSACFGLFINENCSKVALKTLRKKYPKYWFSIAKTI